MIDLEIFKLNPRLSRLRHLGLFCFWLSFFILVVLALGIIPIHPIIFSIIMFFISTIVATNLIFIKIRRLNDFNFSGWWVLLLYVPLVGVLWFLAIFCIPGTNGSNGFGNQVSYKSNSSYLLIMSFPIIVLAVFILKFLKLF